MSHAPSPLLHRITLGWPLVAALIILASNGATPTAVRLCFFLFFLLWPLTLVLRILKGARWSGPAAVVVLALIAVQALVPAPSASVPAHERELRFTRLEEQVRHEVLLPVSSAEWQRHWQASPPPQAYVYVRVALAPNVVDPQLMLRIDGEPAATLSPATRLVERPPAPADTRAWHRVPVERAILERPGPRHFAVGPLLDAPFVPEQVGIVGGFSFRPTRPPAPSAYFDGERWSTDKGAALSWPGPRGPGVEPPEAPWRYHIEVRLVDPKSRRLVAAYY